MSNMPRAEDILAEYIEIRSPSMLVEIAADLRALIDRGQLRQVFGNVPIAEINQTTSFPADIISIEFETIPGGTKYRLSCETYHGLGGVFQRME